MSLKHILRESELTKELYQALKKKQRISHHGCFKNRSILSENLCLVLAGYKPFLYLAVFGRIERFLPKNFDICIISSGLYSDELDRLCEHNGWSYLSIRENHVSLAQNVAISLHPKAKYIFKLDEDIFITENYFENMLKALFHAKQGKYTPGVIAPLIPVNGYGHIRILEKLSLLDLYCEKFETPKYMGGYSRQIEYNPDVAKFFWGEGGIIPSIDEMNKKFSKQDWNEYPCPIRFSIGAILFERKLWEEMGYFTVVKSGNHMGKDEIELCSYCCISCKPIMVSENIVVGHLAFSKQNEAMHRYFIENSKKFLAIE